MPFFLFDLYNFWYSIDVKCEEKKKHDIFLMIWKINHTLTECNQFFSSFFGDPNLLIVHQWLKWSLFVLKTHRKKG